MSRVRRVLKWLAISAAALALVLTLAAFWLLHSQTGLRTVLRIAGVQTERADGSLLGGFELRRLSHELFAIDRLDGNVDLGWTIRLRGLRLAGLSLPAPSTSAVRGRAASEVSASEFTLPVLTYPLALELADARLWNLRGAQPAMPLDELRVERALLQDGRLSLSGVEGDYESLRNVLDGEIDSAAGWTHQLSLRISGGINTATGLRQVQARVDAKGTPQRTELRVVSEKPMSAHLALVLEQLLSAPSASFDSTVAAFAPAAVGYSGAPIQELAWQIKGRYSDGLDLNGRVDIDQTRLDIDLEQLTVNAGIAQLRRLAIAAPDLAARIDLEGALSLPGTTVESALIAQIHGLPLAWPADPSAPRLTGTLRLDGHPEALRASYRGELYSPLNKAQVTAQVALEDQQLAIESLELSDGRGTVRATGKLPTSGNGPVEMQLDLAALDLSVVHPELAGPWAGRVALSSELLAGVPGQSRLQIADLRGRLRGLEVDGTAAIAGRGPLDAQGELSLSIGASQIKLDASNADAPMRLDLDLRDIKALDPALAGQVSGQIEIQRSLLAPRVDLSLLAPELRYGDQTATELRVTATLSRDGAQQRVEVAVAELLAGGDRVRDVAARLTGDQNAHALELRGLWRERTVEAALSGGLDAKRNWRGQVERLMATDSDGSLLALQAPTALAVMADGELEVAPNCVSGVARLCWSAKRSASGAVDAALALDPLNLAMLRKRITELDAALGDYQVVGVVALDTRVGDSQLVAATLTVDAGALAGAALGSNEIRDINGRLDAVPEGELTRLRGQISSTLGTLVVDAGVGAALAGTLALDIADLAPLLAGQSALAESTGSARLRLDLAGVVAAPELSGELSIEDFATELLPLGIRLRDGRVRIVQRAAGEPWQLEAQVQSGAGQIGVNGELAWDPTISALTGQLQVDGTQATVVDMPAARVVASPQLKLNLDGQGSRLSGRVAIDQALLNVEKLEGGAAGASPDVVVIDDPAPGTDAGLPLESRVRLVFGDQVELRGYGVKAMLSGELEVRDRPGRPTTGRGELRLAGSIAQYGKDLELKRGRVLFGGGPVDNPGLDLLAERQIREVKAGLRISGTAAQPILTLVSDPRLPEGEILSYLVLGRPLAEAGSGEGARLQAASAALGGALASSQIGQRLGLDDASIQDGALTVGKYLSPKLYLGYGSGLFEPGQFMTIRYELRPWLTAELKSGATERSTRLLYRRESRD